MARPGIRCPCSISCWPVPVTEGVTYRHAVALLGVTDAALLDEMADALAAGDGSSVFGVVDKVVEAGHDPRRFAADLLQRMRDLVILGAVPDAAGQGSDRRPGGSAGLDGRSRPRSSASQPFPGSPKCCTPAWSRCAAPPRRGWCWN